MERQQRSPRLVALAIAAIVVTLLALSLPEAASASPQSKVAPTVTCVDVNTDGSITAHWGYTNTWGSQVTVQVGSRTSGDNLFSPNPEDRGQPTKFQPGTFTDVFTVTFTGASLTWTLDDSKVSPANSATASASSTRCAPVPALGLDSPLPLALLAVGACVVVLTRRRGSEEALA